MQVLALGVPSRAGEEETSEGEREGGSRAEAMYSPLPRQAGWRGKGRA